MGPGELEVWSNHFEYHAEHPSDVGQGIPDCLTDDERRLVASSIAAAQLGHASSGPDLLSSAEHFARAKRVPQFARIIELLIHEELRHASLLCAFMRDHWMPAKRSGWRSRLFGYLRWPARLDRQLTALVGAELIGVVYYRSLESVTGSQRLRLLCRIIVADKLAHVGFGSDVLAMLRAGHTAPFRAVTQQAHRVFFACSAFLMWLSHRSVLRRAGHDAGSFLNCCLAQYDFYCGPTQVRTAAVPNTLG